MTKLTKISTRENSAQQVLFHSSRCTGSIKSFSIRNFGQYKNSPWDKFVKKKTFCKTFPSKRNFFRITMFSWWFSWFFRVLNVYQCFFTLNTLFNEVDRRLGHGKKHFVRCHLYRVFFKKNCYRWLKLMTCSYTWREQILYRK